MFEEIKRKIEFSGGYNILVNIDKELGLIVDTMIQDYIYDKIYRDISIELKDELSDEIKIELCLKN